MTPGDLFVTPTGARWMGRARFMGRVFPCVIGRGGVIDAAAKREGDGATPGGVHGIVGMLYRADRIARPAGWALPIGPGDLWSDDSRDEDYNLMVRRPYAGSHERLRRPDPMYDLILLTDWNWPRAERGRGSAIFLHVWRGPGRPTAGCMAFAHADLIWIAARLRHAGRVIVAQP